MKVIENEKVVIEFGVKVGDFIVVVGVFKLYEGLLVFSCKR